MTKYFSLALEKIGKDWGGHIIAALIYVIIIAVLSRFYVGFVLNGAFTIGYYYFLKKKLADEKAELADLFIAFKETKYILPAILASVVSGIIIFVGYILLILPGIVAMAAFMFVYLIILDGEMNFWDAMMKSKDIVAKKWFDYCIFIVIGVVIILGGVLFCGIGVLVALPVVVGAITLAYNDTKIDSTSVS